MSFIFDDLAIGAQQTVGVGCPSHLVLVLQKLEVLHTSKVLR